MTDSRPVVLSTALEDAPIGLVVLNNQDEIVAVNNVARQAGLTTGTLMHSYISELQEPFCEAIRFEAETKSWPFRVDSREKRFSITFTDAADGLYLWLHDLSEQLALAEKVRQLKEPGSKRLRQINHQATTALGYAELLEVIMQDHEVLTSEKLSAVMQYQDEVRTALQVIQQVAQQERDDRKTARAPILVAEGHVALSELITELLRAEGYKVESFSEAESALKYVAVNRHVIGKAIVDDKLTGQDDVSLISALRALAPELEIVTLTDDASVSSGSIQKPLDFHLLLKAVDE